MSEQPVISLIVPTRNRVRRLRNLLDSLGATTTRPSEVEVVLVVDEDDTESLDFRHDGLPLRRAVVAPGLSMGALNTAGYDASAGRYLMLLNDDVIVRTRGWDERVLACFRDFPDDVALIHVNDLLFRESLCTFPFVTRTYCTFAGGICPPEYRRYRIDDHIGDVFNLLTLLNERRITYLPDVIFEHFHYDETEAGARRYAFDPAIMAQDAPRFEALRPERMELVRRLKEHIDERSRRAADAQYRCQLDGAPGAFELRVPQRLRVRGDFPDLSRASVTVGVLVGSDGEDEGARLSLSAVRRYSPGAEIVTLQPDRPSERPGRSWNQLRRMTDADYLAVVSDRIQVGPGWLDGLLRGLRDGAAIVTPLLRDEAGGPIYAGLTAAVEPGADPDSPRPLLTLNGEAFLVDTARCHELLADERHGRYFADLDLGLRAWQRGLPVACAPSTVVTRLRPQPLPADCCEVHELFERDRRLFADTWLSDGRLRLDERLADAFRGLHRMHELAPDVLRLLRRERREKMSDYRIRAGRVFDEARLYPVLSQFLADAALQELGKNYPDVHDPQTGHLAWLVGLASWPVEVERNYRGYRLMLCGEFLAVPMAEGAFDLGRYRRGDYSQTYAAEALELLRREIDTAQANATDTARRREVVRS